MENFKELLEQLAEGENLSEDQAKFALEKIISGEVNNERIAAFLFGMKS